MELQARVRVWGRPRGRSGARVPSVSATHFFREDARVGAGSYNLRDELGEDSGGVATLRQGLTWVDGGKKTVGFGEKHPTQENTVDGMRSQADRRVEVMFFDGGEEPSLAAANGEDIYDGVTFERTHVEPMKSARRWRAYWEVKVDPATGEELPARMGDDRKMILEAPGLGAGEAVEFLVSMVGYTFERELHGTAVANGANSAYSDWDAPDEPPPFRELKSGEPFPVARYSFTASAGGRTVKSKVPMPYEDTLAVILVFRDDQGNESILSKRACTVSSPWGRRMGVTDDSGVLRQAGLPPGGVNISVGQSILMQTGNVWLDDRAGTT